MKKHYYISKNEALCSFYMEKPRQGHIYIGEHKTDEDAIKFLYSELEILIEHNNKTKAKVGLRNYNSMLQYKTDTYEGIIKGYLNEKIYKTIYF